MLCVVLLTLKPDLELFSVSSTPVLRVKMGSLVCGEEKYRFSASEIYYLL